jgi:hypothetical protein
MKVDSPAIRRPEAQPTSGEGPQLRSNGRLHSDKQPCGYGLLVGMRSPGRSGLCKLRGPRCRSADGSRSRVPAERKLAEHPISRATGSSNLTGCTGRLGPASMCLRSYINVATMSRCLRQLFTPVAKEHRCFDTCPTGTQQYLPRWLP